MAFSSSAGEVARVEDEDLKAGRQKHVVQAAQVVAEDAVGERWDDDADGAGARRGEGAGQLVRDIGEVVDRALDALPEVRAKPSPGGAARATR